MRHPFLKIFATLGGLYLVLHLALASSFVQGRVLEEVRRILHQVGLDLSIESIEFSAFSPKIYLNRVSLQTTREALIQLPEPLSIDKIKIEFQPLALIYGQIIISDAELFHPNILLKNADVLYRKVTRLLDEQKKWMVKGGRFSVVLKKIGVVDAVIAVNTQVPPVTVDSGRFSVYVEQSARDQQTVRVQATGVKFDREDLHLLFKTIDVDVDLTPKSIRANKVTLEGEDFFINLKGASALSLRNGKGPESFHAAYDLRLPMHLLNQIKEIKDEKLPAFKGSLFSSGNIESVAGKYRGAGKFRYQSLGMNGYELGSGELNYRVDEKKLNLSELELHYGNGQLKSAALTIDLQEKYAVKGEFQLSNLQLEKVLESLKSPDAPIRLGLSGNLKLAGTLAKPIALEGQLKGNFNKLIVLSHNERGVVPGNIVIDGVDGTMDSQFQLSPENINLHSELGVLNGKAIADGTIGFDNTTAIKVEGHGLSLTALKHIDDVTFGGLAQLNSSINVKGGVLNIAGKYEVANAEIAGIVLGTVKGSAHYQDDLLSFESLELPALETIRSSGYVDFRPKKNHYRFQASTRRASVDQVFDFFKKQELNFSKPKGGEVGARVIIEGGHDTRGIQVQATGSVRGVRWYDEKWLSGNFAFNYRPDAIDISRAMLMKKSGALGVRGHFAGNASTLSLQSFGLRLEDLDHIGRAPLTGELRGQLVLEGDLMHPRGRGDVGVSKATFRGSPIGDSRLSIREKSGTTEFLATLMGERLHARLLRGAKDKKESSDLLINFKDFDFAPFLALWLGRDLPPLNSVKAVGDLSLSGVLEDWDSMKGSGTLASLKVDLKQSPMKSERPIVFTMDAGSIKIPRFELVGMESQISGDLNYREKGPIKGSLDAKMDLQYLQPFIPGLEFGTGKVTAGIRLSGNAPNFDVLGNVILEDGTFRISEVTEEFRGARAQLTLTQDKISVDRFEATHGGGLLAVKGDVGISRFTAFMPNLQLVARRVGFRQKNYLTLQLSGDFFIRGEQAPYLLGGKCEILEGHLTEFNIPEGPQSVGSPALRFDLHCNATEKLFVTTDVMDAEFKGDFRLLGDTQKIGLLGSSEGLKGNLFFKETKFTLSNAVVKFEDPKSILPRFNVAGKSYVKEQRATVPIEYEVNLQAFGVPSDYKIRLSSTPALQEPDIIALLVLGVTTRGQDDNYLDFGTTIVGKTPLQSKIQSELGVEIKVNMQRGSNLSAQGTSPSSGPSGTGDSAVPAVKIEKDITKKTKLSYSNTLDQVSVKEFKIEQLLDENFTLNATAVDKIKGSSTTESVKSYGLDLRYRFQFE